VVGRRVSIWKMPASGGNLNHVCHDHHDEGSDAGGLQGHSHNGMEHNRPHPPHNRTPRESLDLIVAPPPITIAFPHPPGVGVVGGEIANQNNLDVVLYNPDNQRVVIWDPRMGVASVQSTARTL